MVASITRIQSTLNSYIGETSKPLEVCIKEQKYTLAQGLLEKSKLGQHAYEEGHKICWKEAKVLQMEQNTIYRKHKEFAHVPGRSLDQSTQLGNLSHLDSLHRSRSK
jgi:hypothetical protein